MNLGRPRHCGLGQRLGIWVQGYCQRGRGTDKAAQPRDVRLNLGHFDCLFLWLTDVSLIQQDLRLWKKLHRTVLPAANFILYAMKHLIHHHLTRHKQKPLPGLQSH